MRASTSAYNPLTIPTVCFNQWLLAMAMTPSQNRWKNKIQTPTGKNKCDKEMDFNYASIF